MQETQHAPLRDHSRLPPNTCQSGGALLIITPTQLPTEANAQPPAPPHMCTRHTRTHKASSQGLPTGSWWPFSAYDLRGFPVRLLPLGETLRTAKPPNITVKILSPLITTLKYRRMLFFVAQAFKAFFIETMLRQLANESKESLKSMFRQKCQVSWLKLWKCYNLHKFWSLFLDIRDLYCKKYYKIIQLAQHWFAKNAIRPLVNGIFSVQAQELLQIAKTLSHGATCTPRWLNPARLGMLEFNTVQICSGKSSAIIK